jgi:signal transduction histidine kinase
MYKTLKFKISITAFLIISFIMAFSAWRDMKSTEHAILEGQKEKASLFSDRIEHGIMVLMLQNNWQDLQKFIVNLVQTSTELAEIRIVNPDSGIIAVSSNPIEMGEKIYAEDMDRIQKQDFHDSFIVEKNGNQYASKLTMLNNVPACHRCHDKEKKVLGIMDIEVSLTKIQQSIQNVKKLHLTDAVIGFFLMGGGFLLVVGILIDRPIKEMIHTIRKIENGDTSTRMNEDKKDEFGMLAKSFNSMLNSLETAQKEIEICHVEQMQRAAKLASLGEIISGIAHEIKNPLAGISCAVQVVQSELSKDDSNRDITKEILHHIKRLDNTVKGLLNYSKPKPPQFLPQKIDSVLDKAIFFVYPEAKKHNVIIDTDIESDLPDIMMDPDQMQQVFLNLIINAVQAMPTGGKLKITISKTEKYNMEVKEKIKDLIATEKLVMIKFEDTGKGINKDNLDRIFDPFFTKKSKGTGLGLSISQRIVQEHGGEMSVKSEVGKGSEFIIYLSAMSNS